ncbi:hypothetical protein GTO10_06235 [Candidatus Saccharibacteria bacterium]|nr:hypothetical protein [Candidatus Saccharibacteria bacterium]
MDAPKDKPSSGGGCTRSATGFWILAVVVLAFAVGAGIQVGRQLGALHGIAAGLVVYLFGGMAFLVVAIRGAPKREGNRRR